ncbi:MAG: protein translocase subunit SecF [Burkholderiales bacterium]
MEFFRIKRDIPFMRHAFVLNMVSLATFLAAVFFIVTKGLHLSVEFTGGTLVELEYAQAANVSQIRQQIESMGYSEPQVQKFGTSRNILIRLPVREGMQQDQLVLSVFEQLCAAANAQVTTQQVRTDKGEMVSKPVCGSSAAQPVELKRSEFVGPSVGDELGWSGAKALMVTIAGIMIYLAFRFEWKFSVAGIIANLHDVIIIIGFFAFFQWEFSLAVLAAILAVLGYSVNESVVIFDRIREAFRKYKKLSTAEVIDHAITSTMSRTVITHGSTLLMVLSMLFFGGPTLHYFALALTIGILFGIYSSVFVAAGIAMWLGVRRQDLIKGGANISHPDDPNAGAVV